MINQILLGLVQSVLGRSNPTARGNHSFNCPFCNHKTPKLEVNLIPSKKNENFWHCWVCDAKGKTLFGLFKRLNKPNNVFPLASQTQQCQKFSFFLLGIKLTSNLGVL